MAMLKERVGNESSEWHGLNANKLSNEIIIDDAADEEKTNMIKSQDYLKGTSARGYVSWRNGDPCHICWPVPQTRENTTLTTMMLVIVVRLASRDLQCDSAGPKARPSAWSVAVEAVNRLATRPLSLDEGRWCIALGKCRRLGSPCLAA